MNWRDYEKEIHQQFQEMYPDAEITHNTTLPGRYSKIDRQIDVLIEDYVAGDRIRIMVDGKYFSENIDVKEVECFIGMMQDVSVDKGLLITQKGYSKAAIMRAHNDPSRIELDILNFEELKQFQGFGALPYSGKHGVVMPSPFGWVIDATRRDGFLATLYQRGLTLEEAGKNKEWMYVKIFSKTDEINDLDTFCKMHESDTLHNMPDAKISYQKTIKRKDANTLLRLIEFDSYPTPEFTGFVEFEEFIFFCVLFTPEELKEKNIKKLEHIISKVLPFQVNVESVLKSNLSALERQMEQTEDIVTKAEIYIGQGNILKQLERFEEAENKYNESMKLLNSSYGAMKGKIDLYLLTNRSEAELNQVIDDFCQLDPTNPTVCLDIIDLFSEYNKIDDFFKVMNRKISDYFDNKEAQGNFNYHLGLLCSAINKEQDAKKYFSKAKHCFSGTIDPKHRVFELIEENLKRIKLSTT
ncbi:restriction endonuclease [Ekhidna sp.]|uniref:restriction endonuclease n=1 Tax=Ekhidna sp. TaxID=2608089 RepID=UPI0032EC698B